MRIFRGWPKLEMLDTDGSPEWRGVFYEILVRYGVAHRIKAPYDTNAPR